MGILGLTGFIDRNTHLLHSHELQDCPVVIDGNNLYHHIYRACHIYSTFGGDYDVFYQQIVINFKSFLKCGVTPFVVLDGGYTKDNRKLKKCIDRAKQRISNVRLASKIGKCQLTPLLAYDTFIQTLDQLKIRHVTCQFEADSEIVKLANRLKCPVLSNDSDFYIFDLTYGFLPLDYLDFNPLYRKNPDGSKSQPFLFCRKYQVDDFISSFEGLNRSLLPVFATLLGNDFVPHRDVKIVYSKIQIPKAVSKKFHVPDRLTRVIKLLHWLEMSSDNSNNVLDKILPYIRSKKKFLSSVEGYFDIVNFQGCDLHKFFFEGLDNFQPRAEQTFTAYNGANFPVWFLTAICKGEITPSLINAAVLHRLIFLCQSEHLRSPSSYHCSEYVRRVIYGILMKSDPVAEKDVCQESESCDYLSELIHAVSEKNKECENDITITQETQNCSEDGIYSTSAKDNSDLSSETKNDETPSNEWSSDAEEVVSSDDDEIDSEEVVSECDEVKINAKDNISGAKPPKPLDFASKLKQTHFEEYQREHGKLKKVYLEPINSIGREDLPSLAEIGDLAEKKRLSILLSVLDVDFSFISMFPLGFSLYPVCLKMWLQSANPQVTEHHLDCAILCPILLHMKKALAKSKKKSKKKKSVSDLEDKNTELESLGETPDNFIDLQDFCKKSIKNDKFQKVLNNLDRYHVSKPDFNKRNKFYPEIPHAFSQLQSCMFEVSNLNKLLRFPLPVLRPHDLINGTFLYNFCIDVMSRPSPQAFMESMLLKGSDIHNIFLKFKTFVVNAMPSIHFAPVGDRVTKRRKKNKGKKKKKVQLCEVAEIEKDVKSASDKESEEQMKTIEGFDIQNPFSLLSG